MALDGIYFGGDVKAKNSSNQLPKVLFYRPCDSVVGGRYRDYLFTPKDKILRQFFDVEIVHDQSRLIWLLRHSEFAMIILYICANIQQDAYSAKLLKHLRANPSPRVLLYNTDPHSDKNYYVQHIAKRLELSAVLSCDPVTEAYFKFDAPLFYWMWSVDPALYVQRDKIYDLFVSTRNSKRLGYYTWRCENGELISDIFPNSVHSTHDSWGVYQEKLASCRFSFTCGSSNNTIVQKHLEIPASGTCLVTEETSLVRMMGFIDGVNCVFGNGRELQDKLEYLKSSPEIVCSIANAGRQLVFDRHTHTQRTQVLELYNLLAAGENLWNYYQPNPFGSIQRKVGQENGLERERNSWLVESPPRDLVAIEEWSKSDELGKLQRFQELRSYLKEEHPFLLEAWANWIIDHQDLSLLRQSLNQLVLSAEGFPDHLVFKPSFKKVYAQALRISELSPVSRSICNLGLNCIDNEGTGFISVLVRLSLVLIGLLLLKAIKIRRFFYCIKVFTAAYFNRFSVFRNWLGREKQVC